MARHGRSVACGASLRRLVVAISGRCAAIIAGRSTLTVVSCRRSEAGFARWRELGGIYDTGGWGLSKGEVHPPLGCGRGRGCREIVDLQLERANQKRTQTGPRRFHGTVWWWVSARRSGPRLGSGEDGGGAWVVESCREAAAAADLGAAVAPPWRVGGREGEANGHILKVF